MSVSNRNVQSGMATHFINTQHGGATASDSQCKKAGASEEASRFRGRFMRFIGQTFLAAALPTAGAMICNNEAGYQAVYAAIKKGLCD